MKRAILSNIFLLVSFVFSLLLSGQNNEEGTWYFHPTYTNPPQKLVETDKEIVYYLFYFFLEF